MKPRAGIVSISGTPVGKIEETTDGTKFSYLPEWLARPDAVPVSLTLPLRPEPYESIGLHPFFENLLPERRRLQSAKRTLRKLREDVFDLLLATCADCVGDVEVRPDVP